MKHRLFFLLAHGGLGWVSLQLAFLARFYLDPLPLRYQAMMWGTLPWAFLVKALAADAAGLTRCLWRYASFEDLRSVVAASVLGSAGLAALAFLLEGGGYPNGPLVLDFLITFAFFAAVRLSGRLFSAGGRGVRGWQKRGRSRVLILGAGDSGDLAIRHVQQSATLGVEVAGVLDDDPEKRGLRLHGVEVRGPLGRLDDLLAGERVDEVVVALPDAPPDVIRRIFETTSLHGCKVKILPAFRELNQRNLLDNPIRNLRLSDFLGRDQVQLDPAPVRESLKGCAVLITGAGGSIGSELARQIRGFPVRRLVMLDCAESALFEIGEEIRDLAPALEFETVLCDIRQKDELEEVFSRMKPDVVFHAAACKHVPMMEAHPLDAARTNVLGTEHVVRCAVRADVKRLLHVSTDKAVSGRSVMGASKAWSERVVVRAARETGRAYSCVRFGNVLGSNGSVIPLFEKQLARGGVLKVTHEEATRYFMTIEEAVHLLIHSESLQGVGEVFILDMGRPVRIKELAEQLLRLSGKHRPGDSDIQIVGLRPGEQLHEKLHTEHETLVSTGIPKINKLSSFRPEDAKQLAEKLDALRAAVRDRDAARIRHCLLDVRDRDDVESVGG